MPVSRQTNLARIKYVDIIARIPERLANVVARFIKAFAAYPAVEWHTQRISIFLPEAEWITAFKGPYQFYECPYDERSQHRPDC